jgi:L-asparaginase II
MPHVVQTRGSCVEAVHPFSAVGVQDGQVVFRLGDDLVTTWRSAAKPFQLATSLELLGDPDLPEAELAIGAASHNAQPIHLDVVRSILQRFGLHETDLRCGAHAPMHAPSAEAILRAGGHFTDLHNNCSGKHAFMLAAALRQGWHADYRPANHPLQQKIRQNVEAWTGTRVQTALDGCGVPTFCLPLHGIARAWAAVAEAIASGPVAGRPDVARLARIGTAMAVRPDLTSGEGRLDLSIVQHAREPMAVKIGAQGVFCLALPERRLGLAVKVHSGNGEALAVAVAHVLAQAAPEAWQQPEPWTLAEVRNVAGVLAGGYVVQ